LYHALLSYLRSGYTGRYLRYAFRGELDVLFARISKTQRHVFSAVGPPTWNDLPSGLHALLARDNAYFYQYLITVLYHRSWAWNAPDYRLRLRRCKFLDQIG